MCRVLHSSNLPFTHLQLPEKLTLPCCWESCFWEMKCDITEKFWYISGRSSVVFAQPRDFSHSYTTRKYNLPDYQPARTTEHSNFSYAAGTCTLPWRWVILPMRGSLQVINHHYKKSTPLWAVFYSWPSEIYYVLASLFLKTATNKIMVYLLIISLQLSWKNHTFALKNVLLPATWQNTYKIIMLDSRFQLVFSFTAVDFITHLKICRDWQ